MCEKQYFYLINFVLQNCEKIKTDSNKNNKK